MEAPGVALAGEAEGALRLVRVENSNDGKRSEWCEFLTKNDQVQIVPASAEAALAAFDTIVGVTRDGHRGIPRGAEPMIEAAWTRVDGERWERVEWSEAFEVEPDTQPKGPADFLESWKKSERWRSRLRLSDRSLRRESYVSKKSSSSSW